MARRQRDRAGRRRERNPRPWRLGVVEVQRVRNCSGRPHRRRQWSDEADRHRRQLCCPDRHRCRRLHERRVGQLGRRLHADEPRERPGSSRWWYRRRTTRRRRSDRRRHRRGHARRWWRDRRRHARRWRDTAAAKSDRFRERASRRRLGHRPDRPASPARGIRKPDERPARGERRDPRQGGWGAHVYLGRVQDGVLPGRRRAPRGERGPATDRTAADSIDDRNPSLLDGQKLFLSVGHDEYWSGAERTAVETAIARGVNVAYLSADALEWQIRLEPGASGTPRRTEVCHKGYPSDPLRGTPLESTEWRSPALNRPENELVGVMYDSYQ